MYANQDELFKPCSNNMLINIIGSNHLHESIISTCLDINEGDYVGKLKIVSLSNADSLFQKTISKEGNSGLVNLEWIKKVTLTRPATIILVYDLKKIENVTWKDYENSIYLEILKVKKIENYNYVNIVVLLFTHTAFTFDSINEDKDRSYAIKKLIDPKNLYYINSSEGIKNISKKLSAHILKITISYYKNLKKTLKNKRVYSHEIKDKEKLVKYNIKLGIVSLMKNKKRNWKYFEEAYSHLCTIDIKNNNNLKNNYMEIKQAADWIYFKIFYLKLYDSNTINSVVSNFNIHMNTFSRNDILSIINEDILYLMEYNWRIMRYEFFSRFLDENGKLEIFNKNPLTFPAYYNLLASFNALRAIKLLSNSEFEKQIILMKNTKYPELKIRDSKFYGKSPRFFIEIDPLTEKETEFNEKVCIKNYLISNNISTENLTIKLNENISKTDKSYKKYFLSNKEFSTISIYLNVLSMMSIDKLNPEKLKFLYKPIISNNDLNKFPDLYLKLLTEYNNICLNLPHDNIEILNNIIKIASFRNLTSEEENIWNDIINKNNNIKQNWNIGQNYILNIDYTINNNNPKLFDIVEYTISISTSLTYINLRSINVIFNNAERNKIFNQDEYIVRNDQGLILNYKIFIKDSDKHLRIKHFKIELNNDNVIILENTVLTNKNKIIYIKTFDSDIVDLQYNKNNYIGINQYYNVECGIVKKDENIEVEYVEIKYSLIDDNSKQISQRSSIRSDIYTSASLSVGKSVENILSYPNVDHEFLIRENDESIVSKNETKIKVINIKHDSLLKSNILINFKESGTFCVKLEAEYKIYKKDMQHDNCILRHSGIIYFDTYVPLDHKYEIYSENFMSIQKMKVYSVGKQIKLNMILINNMKFNLIINKIEVMSATDFIILDSLFNNEIEEVVNVRENTEYILPIIIFVNEEYSGVLGKIKIYWKDKGLVEYNNDITNISEFTLPEINVKKYDIELNYEIEKILNIKSPCKFKINLINKSKEFRKILFLIDNSPYFVVSGQVKKKILFYPDEEKELIFTIIPLSYGKLKLPPFKIMEFPLLGNYENKIYSIYYLTENILIKGEI